MLSAEGLFFSDIVCLFCVGWTEVEMIFAVLLNSGGEFQKGLWNVVSCVESLLEMFVKCLWRCYGAPQSALDRLPCWFSAGHKSSPYCPLNADSASSASNISLSFTEVLFWTTLKTPPTAFEWCYCYYLSYMLFSICVHFLVQAFWVQKKTIFW